MRRPSYRAAIPLVVFTAAALLGVRNVGGGQHRAGARARLGAWPTSARSGAIGAARSTRWPSAVLALVGVLLVTSSLAKPAWQLESFPVDAVVLARPERPAPPRRAHWRPRTPSATTSSCVYGDQAHAFVDDRVDMYPKPVVEDFLVLLHGSPGWREVLDRRDRSTWSSGSAPRP